MIVRILGEGQFEIGEDDAAPLEQLDHTLAQAIEADDEAAFEAAVNELHAMVKSVGTEVSAETITPSDLTLPHAGSSLAEVRELLASEDTAGD